MNFKKNIFLLVIALSSCTLHGMHSLREMCKQQYQKQERLALEKTSKLNAISKDDLQKAFKTAHIHNEYKPLLRDAEREISLCMSFKLNVQ